MSRPRAVLALVIAVALGMGTLVAQASNGPRALDTVKQRAPTLRPATVAPGTRVHAKGRLDKPLVRRVVLQRRVGATWRRVTSARTDETGRYRFVTVAPSVTSRLRVKAPAFERRGRSYARVLTAAAVLRVTTGAGPTPTPAPTPTAPASTIDLEVPATALGAGPRPDAVVRTVGVPTGTPVGLERRTGSQWQSVGTASVDETGTARVPLPLGDLGTGVATLRAVVHEVGTTPLRTVEVLPPATIDTPADDAGVDGPFDVSVHVDPRLSVTQVRLFLDGFVLPAPVAPVQGQPGTWAATVDPASVAITRRHVDLTARVTTADGSALAEPVRLDLLPTTGGLPPGFRIDTVASGFDLPTSFAALDAHRVLVAEKAGLLRLARDGVASATPVLDLRDAVADTLDSGILDVTLDPDFGSNGWFYVAYVADDGGDSTWHSNRVVRYTLDGDVADPSSAHVVLGGVPLSTCVADATVAGCFVDHDGMHTVDDLQFAADGSLLVSVGDGAPADPSRAVVAQRLGVLAGKVLRVDPDTGLGLPDNPYFEPDRPTSNRGRVWASGFRNPFRMALSPSGDLYVGDVGEVGFEEVDRVVAGGNYGWPCFEGTVTGTAPDGDPDCTDVRNGAVVHRTPLLAYPHQDFAGSITLGAFYTGAGYPPEYDGALFLGDYTMGRIWTLDVTDPQRLVSFGSPPGLGAGVAYAMGPDGAMWYADISTGSLRRIVHDPDATTCPSGQFLAETFRNRDLQPEADGQPWVTSCVGTPPSGPSLVAPGSPNQGDGWSMRWQGTPQLAPGTYRLTAQASGTITVTVDGQVVPDGGTFTVGGTDVNEATADIQVVLLNYPPFDDEPYFVDFDWNYLLSWHRVGSAPVVTLHDLGQGGRVAAGSTAGWTVSATDAEDGPIPADGLRVTVTMLHFGTDSPHAHPAGSFPGVEGSFVVDDVHAPGKIAYRVVGVATDSSGWVAESDPVYVCPSGAAVGPCS